MELYQEETERHIYSIAEITREIKQTLESAFPPIWIEGEISNFKKHSSGHMYLILKDEHAQIPAVMWRGHNLRLLFTPQDGMKVLAYGNITVYEKRGSYQFEINKLQPSGVGELQLAFEQLKLKLRDEGLFDSVHKKKIPEFPERIGIVTSPTGAVIKDLTSVFSRRFQGVQLILAPVRVQGEDAAQEIAGAIEDFNEFGEVDVLIICRGGGSLEDLWPFNQEIVARAVFNSRIPVISAVGHEIDFSISDFVADLRAPTPSAAAELSVPNREDLSESIKNSVNKCYRLLWDYISLYKEKVSSLRNSYALRKPLDAIKQNGQRLDELVRSLELQSMHRINSKKQLVDAIRKQLFSLSPESILNRGYSLCFSEDDGKLLRKATDVKLNDKIQVQFFRGRLKSKVEKILPDKDYHDKSSDL